MIMLLVLFSIFVRWLRLFRVRTLNMVIHSVSSGVLGSEAGTSECVHIFGPLDSGEYFKTANTTAVIAHLRRTTSGPCLSDEVMHELHESYFRAARARRQGPVLTMALESANL